MIFEVVFTNVYKRYGSIAADLDPRSKIQDSRKNFLDPRSGSKKFFLESWILDLGSRPWIQEVFPRILDLGSKKFFLGSWILDLGSRPWIQEDFSVILDLGSWIQINCYGSIVFIYVYKRLETCQNPPCPEKGFREGPKYWKIQISPDPSHVWTSHLLSKLPYTFSRVNFQDFCNISLNWISL